MTYCFQCGLNGTPERAIGVDEDGEPACTLHRDKSVPLAAPKVEPSKPRPAPEEKVDMETIRRCAFEGCEKQLIVTNRSGYCTKHFYESKRKHPKDPTAPRIVVRRKPSPETRDTGVSVPGVVNSGAVTVRLTGAQLDKFLCSLPIDVKHRLLTTFLEQ